MKRIAGVLPHVINAVYIAMLNSVGLSLSFLRAGSLVALLLLGFLALREKKKEDLSAVQKGYLLYFSVNVIGFWILPGDVVRALRSYPRPFCTAPSSWRP